MNVVGQVAVIAAVAFAASGATALIRGAPVRQVFCDAAKLKPDEVCLSKVIGEWKGGVVWVDARPRKEWLVDGVKGSSRLRLTLSTMPIARQVNQTEVPPMLTRGRGCPVTGTRLTATAMLIMAWRTSMRLSPTATSDPKGLSQRCAIRTARSRRMR